MDLLSRSGKGRKQMQAKKTAVLDGFRIVAALLVVAIHTSPLAGWSSEADFFLTRVLARVAVPFFFMITGQFVVAGMLERRAGAEAHLAAYMRKLLLMYAAVTLLYLPVSLHAGYWQGGGIGSWLRMLFFDGTFYHLWYFPACLIGLCILSILRRFLSIQGVGRAVLVLYLVGLLGGSYYGLTQSIPFLEAVYERLFQIFSYTRNGFFYAPLFLFMGAAAGHREGGQPPKQLSALLFFFVLLTAEAFALRYLKWQRHDSMYVMLVPVMALLYQLLVSKNQGSAKLTRTAATGLYLLHPLGIVLVRALAKLLHAHALWIDNSLLHYVAVSCLSLIAAYGGALISQYRRAGKKLE